MVPDKEVTTFSDETDIRVIRRGCPAVKGQPAIVAGAVKGIGKGIATRL